MDVEGKLMNWKSRHAEPKILPGPHFRSSLPVVELEIAQGEARNVSRQVQGPVYLIGTTVDCDLVLGDLQFPEVFAYLFLTKRGVSVRRLGTGPELTVNGRLVQSSPLFDGDVLSMGRYQFCLRVQWIHNDRPGFRNPSEDPVGKKTTDEAIAEVNDLLCSVRRAGQHLPDPEINHPLFLSGKSGRRRSTFRVQRH
ncbi:MAG: hypothetical protein CMJ81_20815 [Planctomycetaceae bacterium]|nr:hypothetical protein [Planctomycetaceae bacterium]